MKCVQKKYGIIVIRGWLLLALLFPFYALQLRAQDSLLFRDYSFVKSSDAWFTSSNSAALTRYTSQNIAEAEVSLGRSKGGFVDYSHSPNAWETTASVQSFYRLDSRTVFFGAISYDYFEGKDMAASAFLSPSLPVGRLSFSARTAPLASTAHLPFDIVEDSLTNLGRKQRNVYRLTGGVGVDIWKGLSLGANLDYTTADYAKYKDLRHKNKLMDLNLSMGIYLPLGRWADLGANYLYHRTTESLQFSTYGKNDKVYQSLVSYAAFMGHREQFGGEGFTDKSRAMPLVSDDNGFGLQFSLHSPSSSIQLFQAFNYLHRNGYYGRKSPFTITYTNHRSHVYDYHAQLTYRKSKSRHRIDFLVQTENLENDVNTFRELKNDAGAVYYNYYTPVKTANKVWVDGRLALTSDFDIKRELPAWTLEAGLNWNYRKQTAYLYPFIRRQRITAREAFASVTRNVVTRRGVWSFLVSGAFGKGSGLPYEDETLDEPSPKMSAPAVMDAWLWQEYQWLTSAQYRLAGCVKYAFLIPDTRLKTHVRLCIDHRKANETNAYSRGCDNTQLTFAVGCTF